MTKYEREIWVCGCGLWVFQPRVLNCAASIANRAKNRFHIYIDLIQKVLMENEVSPPQAEERTETPKSQPKETKKPRDWRKLLLPLTKKNIVMGVLVLAIVILAFSIRAVPAKYNELQELDVFFMYRMGQYMLTHNMQLPTIDVYRHHPFGSNPLEDEYSVPMVFPPYLYLLVGQGMSFLQFAIIYPAIAGALAVVAMFFLGRELYGEKAGLLAAFFLAVLPANITRTSAGFYDKEASFGLFLILAVLFFVASFRRNSWKLGIVAGIFLGIAGIGSGMTRYIYIFYSLFGIVLLIINRHKNLLYSYGPTVVVSVALQLFAPKANLDSVFFYGFVGVFVLLVLRELVERFRVIKEKDLKYFSPGLLVLSVVGILIAGMFSNFVFGLLNSLIPIIFTEYTSPIGYTVAEQQPGDIRSAADVSGLQFSSIGLGPLTSSFSLGGLPVPGILSIFFFMVLGIVLIVLRLVKRIFVDKKLMTQDLILILLLLWIIAGIWSIYLFVRLVFIFGPPAVLLAGISVAWGINRLLGWKRLHSMAVGRHMPLVILAVVAAIMAVNVSNAYGYTNNLGPTICILNSQILIDGEKCLVENGDGTITFASGQPWYELMDFLRSLPEPKNILTWWDFGHWFHARGETPSVSDGGKGPRTQTAEWYISSVDEWDEWLSYVKDRYQVTHIIQDYTLPGKFGAITAIATEGQGTAVFQQFSQGQTFQRGNVTIQEFNTGNVALWIPIDPSGNLAAPPSLLVGQGGAYSNQLFINRVCTPSGIVTVGQESPDLPGCLIFSSFGIYLSSPQIEYYSSFLRGEDQASLDGKRQKSEAISNSIFTSLQFMEGAGLPVEKVFDNRLIKVYEIKYQ